MGCPIFAKLPNPLVLFCPILLDPHNPPKIGHHLCMFPKYTAATKQLETKIKSTVVIT